MSEQMNKPIDPFLSARRQGGIHVALEAHDVQALRPQWSDEQARIFLARHAPAIAHVMLMAGEQVLRHLLETEKHDC